MKLFIFSALFLFVTFAAAKSAKRVKRASGTGLEKVKKFVEKNYPEMAKEMKQLSDEEIQEEAKEHGVDMNKLGSMDDAQLKKFFDKMKEEFSEDEGEDDDESDDEGSYEGFSVGSNKKKVPNNRDGSRGSPRK